MSRLTIDPHGYGPQFARGDRIEVNGKPHVVKVVGRTTLTVADRSAWYWRVVWSAQDAWRHLRSARRSVSEGARPDE